MSDDDEKSGFNPNFSGSADIDLGGFHIHVGKGESGKNETESKTGQSVLTLDMLKARRKQLKILLADIERQIKERE